MLDTLPLGHDDPKVYRDLAERFRNAQPKSEYNAEQAKAWDAYAARLESWHAANRQGRCPLPPVKS